MNRRQPFSKTLSLACLARQTGQECEALCCPPSRLSLEMSSPCIGKQVLGVNDIWQRHVPRADLPDRIMQSGRLTARILYWVPAERKGSNKGAQRTLIDVIADIEMENVAERQASAGGASSSQCGSDAGRSGQQSPQQAGEECQ